MSNIADVGTTFEEFTKDGLVLIDFWAGWCGPCRLLSPLVEGVADKYDQVKFGKVDVDAYPSIAQKYNIFSIPTLALIKDGVEVDRLIGLQSAAAVEAMINKHL